MSPNLDPKLWAGGVFAATTMIALIVLQAIGLWWHGRGAQKGVAMACIPPRENENANRWATFALIAFAGTGLGFLWVKDTAYLPLSVLGIFAVVPYAYLEKKRAERETWLTRGSVARGLDELLALAASGRALEILDAHPWLERNLKRNTFFQRFDARLAEWVGQGLAQRGSKTDLEYVARQLQSEDLFQFLRRAYVKAEDGDARRVFLDAARTVVERIHLDAESFALRVLAQTFWLWLGLIAVLFAAALLPLGGK